MDPALKPSNRAGRAFVLVMAAVAGCKDAGRAPAGKYRATGTLIHDGLAADDRAGWATEIEIMKSELLLGEVGRELERGGAAAPMDAVRRGLVVKRRADSRLIEVSVHGDDDRLARAACNQILETYVEYRMHAAMKPAMEERRRLAEELDRLKAAIDTDAAPPDANARYATLVARLSSLELADTARRNDVRLLDACRVVKARS